MPRIKKKIVKRRAGCKYRLCTVCRQYKLIKNFYNCKAIKDGLSYRCIKCDDKARAKWLKDNPEKARESARGRNIKIKYGINKKDYEILLKEQRNRCAICRTKTPRTLNNLSFCIDHCHKKNIIRGLLCSICNRILGLLKDNIKILYKMIEYLNKHR